MTTTFADAPFPEDWGSDCIETAVLSDKDGTVRLFENLITGKRYAIFDADRIVTTEDVKEYQVDEWVQG